MDNNSQKSTDLLINEDFNLFKTLSTRENIDNPYPIYNKLRNYDPVFSMKSPTGFLSENIWILTRYEDISNVLINKKFGRGNKFGKIKEDSKYYSKLNSLTQMRQHWVTFLDPPDHTRIRNFLNKALTPKMVSNLKPNIVSIASYLAGKFDSDEVEFISEFAYPLAAITLAELFGIPKEDRDMIDKWAMKIVKTLDVVTNQFTNEDLQDIYKSASEIKEYFLKIIEEKSGDPKDDMISKLLTISDNEDRLSKEEIAATLVLMTMDAHEAPKNLITNGLYALLKNPHQLEKLKKNPELMDSAIDEFLRYDSPAQFTGRRTNEDEVIGGKEIKKGVQIICMLGSGNRDPERFEDPDSLDIERKKNVPLSFGGGIHHCLGAGLAKLEVLTGMNIILEKFPELSLKNKEYHYHQYLHSRGLESLELNLK
ncbi:MAG TPA: cytochrome P450 [Ignavibacteria bacterium]|nr:cytochrome P450 [Ignavibacteria bacterium]